MISPWAAVKDPPHPETLKKNSRSNLGKNQGKKNVEDDRSILAYCRAVPSYAKSGITHPRTAHEFQVQLICLAYDLRGDIGSTEFAD